MNFGYMLLSLKVLVLIGLSVYWFKLEKRVRFLKRQEQANPLCRRIVGACR